MKLLLLKASRVILALLLGSGMMYGQLAVSGNVTDTNGEALIGVSIVERGTNNGTITDLDGNFSLEVAGEGSVLIFSYLGYENAGVTVGNDRTTVNLQMESAFNQLDEVIVTGLASSVKRSNLANAVASISNAELVGVTQQPTMEGALYGKFTGADIRSNSGAPGGGFSVRLRGVTSVFLNQQPLYIIDGVYLDNSAISLGTNIITQASAGGARIKNQDDASNRIADIIPEDIESIEILKGASAAAIYGVGGAGGVVLIKTKRGDFNSDTRVNFSQTIGFSRPTQLLGDRGWDRQKVVDVFGEPEAQLFDQNGLNDYEAELFDHNSLNTTSYLSVSGGSNKTRFYLSGTYRNQEGLVENTGYEKASIRANINHKLTDKLNLDFASSVVKGIADRGLFNNSNANTTVGYALAFTRPWDNLFPDENGNYPANPRVGSNVLETVNKIKNQEDVARFFGSVNLSYNLYQSSNQSLKIGTELGYDYYNHKARGLFPQELSFFRDPSSLRGVSIAGNTDNIRSNISAYLVHTFNTESNMNFRSQLGVIQLDQDQERVTTIASGLNGSQTNVDQSANISAEHHILKSQEKGFFFQEEVNWDDKVIVTVGLRGDKSSNNGDPNEVFWNPKANLAVNIHKLTDLGEHISQLKPRVAFGQSARFAGFDDRFNSLEGTLIQGNAGLSTASLRGNPDVSPETQTEIEAGVDMGFLDNRFLLTASYYIKTIDDLLLRAAVPTSSGFTNQVVNAGELENKGIELGLEAEVLKRNEFSWALGLNWWKNNSEVTRLDIPAFNLGGFAAFLGQGRIQEGESATQLIGTIDPSRCPNGDCTGVDPEGDGFMKFGDMEADFNMSWTNSIVWRDFEFNMLWHWKNGGDGINLSTLLYDLGAVTWDFDDTDLDPTGELSNGDYRLAALGVHPGVYIEDASYLRLREIGLYYNLGAMGKVIKGMRLGVSARNLVNFFDYNSYDPEVSNFGGNVLINSVEVTPYPSSRQFNFHLSVNF